MDSSLLGSTSDAPPRDPRALSFDSLSDPDRLAALREAGLLDTFPEESFDRLTRLSAALLNAPVALFNLVDDQRQFSKSCFVPPDWPAGRDTEIADSFCKHVVRSREPLLIEDAAKDPRVSSTAVVQDLGVRSYLGVPLITSDGYALGAFCVADFAPRTWSAEQVQHLRDLGETVMTEIELRHESKLHARCRNSVEVLLNHLPGMAYRCRNEPDWPMELVSEGAAELTGYTAEEFILGKVTYAELIHPRDRGSVWKTVQDAVAERRPFRLEYRIRTRAGEEKWVWEQGQGRFSPAEDLIALEGFIKDATGRKQAAEALRQSEMTLRTVLDTSPDIIEILDPEGCFRWVSPAMREALGYDPEGLIGTPMLDLLHPEDRERFAATMREVADGRLEELSLRYRALARAGEWITLEAHGRAIRNGHLAGAVLVVRDMTDQVRREEALHAAKGEAERANRAKSEFLSRMSHELRTPLNAILGFGQLLEVDHTVGDQESVAQILKAGRHLLTLIDEVLDVARIEAGRMSLSVEAVSLGGVLRESLDLVRHLATQHGVTLDPGSAWDTKQFVAADQQRLKQVLLNLLSNAIKYNRQGGTVTITCEPAEDGRFRIAVQDTGYGIVAEGMERLFTAFERLDAEQRGVEGTGLGLALSKGLVEAMGGRLGVDGVEGEGSTFWVELAGATPTDVLEPAGSESVEARRQDVEQTHTVLFIEDNLANVRLMERIFAQRPHVRLLTAMQGRLGLELAREHRPDLVLLDLNLPDISGREVLEVLRQDPATRQIPVVMVSADAVPSQVERLRAAGAQGYVTKPFDIALLLRTLDESLGGMNVDPAV